jgi:hypothetical protein
MANDFFGLRVLANLRNNVLQFDTANVNSAVLLVRGSYLSFDVNVCDHAAKFNRE